MSDVIKYPLSAVIELCKQLDNDTPETDANTWSDSSEGVLFKVVSVEFARQLERERDEARIDAQKSKAYKRVLKETNLRQTERIRYLEGATNHACGTPLSVALRERDEAREAFVIATDQMVIAQGKVREANKERDEAREKAERYRFEANAMMMQRDEAREEIKRLKIILDLIKKDVS